MYKANVFHLVSWKCFVLNVLLLAHTPKEETKGLSLLLYTASMTAHQFLNDFLLQWPIFEAASAKAEKGRPFQW